MDVRSQSGEKGSPSWASLSPWQHKETAMSTQTLEPGGTPATSRQGMWGQDTWVSSSVRPYQGIQAFQHEAGFPSHLAGGPDPQEG